MGRGREDDVVAPFDGDEAPSGSGEDRGWTLLRQGYDGQGMEDGGEAAKRQIFSRLFVETGVAGGFFEKAGAHFAQVIHRDTELRGVRRFAAGRRELQFGTLDRTESFEFRREAKGSGNNFWGGRNLRAWSFDGGRGLSAERTWVGGWRGEILQRGFSRQIGRRVLDGGQGKRFSIGRP